MQADLKIKLPDVEHCYSNKDFDRSIDGNYNLMNQVSRFLQKINIQYI